MQIVPAVFLVMQYTNDGRVQHEDAALQSERVRQSRKNSVELYQMHSAESTSGLTSFCTLEMFSS